jgi:outer membrane protein, multidrug efflux system
MKMNLFDAVGVAGCAALLSLSTTAGAATAPPPRPGATPAPALATGVIPVPAPPPIEIDDPMLAPVPQAAKVLRDWKEALGLIVSRSTDIAIALQEVERAEGNARIALAAALPTITGTVQVTGQLITPPAAGVSPLSGIPATLDGAPARLGLPLGLPGSDRAAVNPIVTGSITASQPILAPRA